MPLVLSCFRMRSRGLYGWTWTSAPFRSRSHQRRKQPQQRPQYTLRQARMAALLSGDLLALGKRFFKIRLHLCVHSGVIEIHGVFKMQIQAAEVQIDRADNSLLRVGR